MKSGGGSEEDGGDGASQTPSGGASSSNTSEGVTKSLKSMLEDMCPVMKKKTRDSDSDGEDDDKPKKGRRVSRNNQTPNPEKDAEVRPAFCRVLVTNSLLSVLTCQVDAKKKELQNMNKDINASEPQITCN